MYTLRVMSVKLLSLVLLHFLFYSNKLVLGTTLDELDTTTQLPVTTLIDLLTSTTPSNLSSTVSTQATKTTSKTLPPDNHLSDTSNDIDISSLAEDLGTWEAPPYFQKKFPYYLSGYDDDDRPIWISEMGKYHVKEMIEAGPETMDILQKYIKQAAHRILQSLREQTTEDKVVSEIIFIIDFDGLDLSQVSHPPTILYVVNLVRTYRDLIQNHLGATIIINANYFAELLINLLRPAFGRVMERTEVYGTQTRKWMPVMRRMLPPDTIPTWYGGHPNYRPIKIYG